MNDEIRAALSDVLKALHKDNGLHADIPGTVGDRCSVQDIVNMSADHVFDNNRDIFGLSRMEAFKIQSYFSRYAGMNYIYINDMYKEFPGVFKGESKEYIDSVVHLDETIPLF